VDRLRTIHAGATIIRRDLGSDHISHPAPAYATALASADALSAPGSRDAMVLSEKLIVELETSDILVIGTPMNNFTVPSVLKTWIDQVVRVGRTFRMTPKGKVGLLSDRPVFVGIASGATFLGDRARQPDFLTPYLSAIFRCIGLTSVHFLPFQGTAFLDERVAATERDLLLKSFEAQIAATNSAR